MTKSTGVSMQGTKGKRVDKGKVRSDCRKCSNRRTKGAISYCDYYDIFSPNKKYCLRYHGPDIVDAGLNKKRKDIVYLASRKAIKLFKDGDSFETAINKVSKKFNLDDVETRKVESIFINKARKFKKNNDKKGEEK